MRIIENGILPPRGYKAITLLNLVFVRRDTRLTGRDIIHEYIHWEQEKELLIIGFYLLYVAEFLIRLAQYKSWHVAYRNISFEREAYTSQNEEYYLMNRKHYAWLKYIKHKSI